MRTSSSCADWENLLQRRYQPCSKFTVMLKKSSVYDWFSRFKNGQEKLEHDQRSGRPSTSRTAEMIEKVRQLIQCDRRMTIVELEREIGISHGSIHAILPNDLKMRLVSAKFVPCGFCITMTHRATHRLLCSNSSPRKAFLSSPNRRTLWISLRVTFGCSLF